MDFLDVFDKGGPEFHGQGNALALFVCQVAVLAVCALLIVSNVHQEDVALLEIPHADHLLRT